MAQKNRISKRKIVVNALKSGAIDPKLSLETMITKFESDFDEVAGYVVAWEKYVLVVSDEITDMVNPQLDSRISALEKKAGK